MTVAILTEQDVLVRIFRLRNSLGSAKALADKISVSESYLSDMINGRRAYCEDLLNAVGAERSIRYLAEKGWKP